MKSLLTILLCFVAIQGYSQEMAITESGDTIFVFNNGTWSYDRLGQDLEISSPDFLNLRHEEVKIDSTFRIMECTSVSDKSINKENEFYSIKFDSEEWKRVPPASINPAATYTFNDESQTLYAMLIAESVEIGTENVYKFALQNAEQNVGATPNIENAEWVKVNGDEMINAQYSIDINGLKFTFNSLFYSSEKGTIQFMTWTFTNLFEEKKPILDNILAGLAIK